MSKVLVCGGRDFTHQKIVSYILDKLYIEYDCQWDTLIHGDARGADSCAAEWAVGMPIDIERYPALWDVHGKAAGFIRNKLMLEDGQPDLVIAFPGGKGTAMMIELAKKAGVEVVDYG